MAKITTWDDLIREYPGMDGPLAYYQRTASNLYKLRTASRFNSGYWKKISSEIFWESFWESSGLDHFALHVATDDPDATPDTTTKVAFYPDERAIKEDRCIRSTIGRFLNRYANKMLAKPLSENQIAHIANTYALSRQSAELKWARTRDEIREVYEEGPSSCMAYDAGHFATDGIHPTEGYATPDWAVAYVQRGERIVARAVTDERAKTYYRIYGNKEALEPLLEAAGYTVDNPETGARLVALRTDRGDAIGPYIDGIDEEVYESTCGKFFIIGEPPERSSNAVGSTQQGSSPAGLLSGELSECERCGDRYNSEEEGGTLDFETYTESCCENCADNAIPAIDARGNEVYTPEDNGDLVYSEDGMWTFLSANAARNNDYDQTSDGEWWPAEEICEIWSGDVIRIEYAVFNDWVNEYFYTNDVVEIFKSSWLSDGVTASTSDPDIPFTEDYIKDNPEKFIERSYGWVYLPACEDLKYDTEEISRAA